MGCEREKSVPSQSAPFPRSNLDIADTLGAVLRSQMPSFTNLSRISQLKIDGFSLLYCSIRPSTSGVATLGFEPPMTPGRMDPVSFNSTRKNKNKSSQYKK